MIHCSTKTIIRYHQNALSARKRASVEKHLSKCRRCHSFSQTVAAAYSYKSPSPEIYNRIMSYYDAAAVKNKDRVSAPGRVRRPYAVPVFQAVAVLLIALTVMVYAISSDTGAKISASRVNGVVKSGNHALVKGGFLPSGSHVETGNNSHVAMISGDMMKLNAGEKTSIFIRSAHKEKATGKTVFNMTMGKGTISAVFDQKQNLEYTLNTPHATITSRGSKIVVNVDSEGTRLIVKNGSADVSSAAGSSITAEEGDGYTIMPVLSMNSIHESKVQDDIVYNEDLSIPINEDFLD
jgi:hypothetical protein